MAQVPDHLNTVRNSRLERGRKRREVVPRPTAVDQVPARRIARGPESKLTQQAVIFRRPNIMFNTGNHVEPLPLRIDVCRRLVPGDPERAEQIALVYGHVLTPPAR